MPQGSLTRAGDLASLLERLDRLHAGMKPAWGSLDAPALLSLAHVGEIRRGAHRISRSERKSEDCARNAGF